MYAHVLQRPGCAQRRPAVVAAKTGELREEAGGRPTRGRPDARLARRERGGEATRRVSPQAREAGPVGDRSPGALRPCRSRIPSGSTEIPAALLILSNPAMAVKWEPHKASRSWPELVPVTAARSRSLCVSCALAAASRKRRSRRPPRSRGFVAELESGGRGASFEAVAAVAEALEVPMAELGRVRRATRRAVEPSRANCDALQPRRA